MQKELLASIQAKTQNLLAAPSCSKEARAAAETWLAALGSGNEDAATAAYAAALRELIMPIDGLLAFASSPKAAEIFGKEKAAAVLKHAQELKAQGVAYCDCPACTAVKAILDLVG